MLLLINSAAHLLVDALCASTLFGALGQEENLAVLILIYNTLAFSSQCLVGIIADRVKKHALSSSLAMITVVLGFALPLPPIVKVILIGAGNSVFHVASGTMTLEVSNGMAGPLGVFVAPGAIGLTLGTLFPELGVYFAIPLLFAAILLPLTFRWEDEPGLDRDPLEAGEGGRKLNLIPMLLLTAAVAVRAIGGTAVSFPWNTTALSALALTACVFAGKTVGGFIADRIGARYTAMISIPVAALLIAFATKYMAPSLVGQFALNLTMPVTLYLLFLAMPDQPGFAFGLAASALWPGTIAGRMMTLSGGKLSVLVLISFLFGLAAILISYAMLKLRHIPPKSRKEKANENQ